MKILIISLTLLLAALLGTAIHRWIFRPRKEKGKQGKYHILCIGDSITYGAGVLYTRRKDSYPAILEKKLGDGYQVLNYGISGATLMRHGDKPYSESFLEAARRDAPQICILMLGTNDSKPYNWDSASYEDTLADWIADLKGFPSKPHVYLMTPPAAFRVEGKPVVYMIQEDTIRDEIYPIVKRQSILHRTGFVDLYAATQFHPELFGDGVHPNKQGNHVIAQHIYDVLKLDLGLQSAEDGRTS